MVSSVGGQEVAAREATVAPEWDRAAEVAGAEAQGQAESSVSAVMAAAKHVGRCHQL